MVVVVEEFEELEMVGDLFRQVDSEISLRQWTHSIMAILNFKI